MASSLICGPCGYENNIKDAKKWCNDCEDGYCGDCEKVHRSTKISRNHKLISIADYLKIKDVPMKQNCEDHGKRFDLYCSTHDKALCIACVNQHKSCADVTPLDEAARNARQSTAFANVEDTINGALENIAKCIKDQESTEKHVENQEQMIRKYLKKIRDQINKQLNVLEQKLMMDLSVKSTKCKSALEITLNLLNSADKKLIQLKEEMQKMKDFASDIQVFLGTREMNRHVANEIQSIKRTINAAHHFKFEAKLDSNISSLLNRTNEMGKILLQEIPTGLQFQDAKISQAQKQVSVSIERVFDSLYLQLKQKLKILQAGGTNITGCTILPNGQRLIADHRSTNKLMRYKEDGSEIRYISVSRSPFDLTSIDTDRIAISYCTTKNIHTMRHGAPRMYNPGYVEIINLKTDSSSTIKANNICWGISHHDGRLYVIVKEEGIMIVDVSGNILNTLQLNTAGVKYISTSTDMICYSDDVHNTVHCCNMEGSEIWVFRHESVIFPAGVSIGDNNDVFVVGCVSNNITLIHRDGTESKMLLTAADGLKKPHAMNYDKNSKTLLVCNENGSYAAVFKVVLNI